MKLGLVLEGGGMRGLYTAGVMDIMIDHQLVPDVICATSAGVTFGLNLPSRQRGRVLRYNLQHIGNPDFISLRSLLRTGNMVNAEFAYDRLPRVLDPFDEAAFEASPTAFYATVTNVLTGQAEYMPITDCFRDMDIVRASASLPFLSRKVYINGVPYLDGGLSDNIPLDKAFELGCDRIIVVLTHPIDYVKKENLAPLARLFYPHDHALVDTITHRDERYNQRIEQIQQLEKEGRIFVFRPSCYIRVGRLEKNPQVLQQMYDLGIHDACAQWPHLQTYLQ